MVPAARRLLVAALCDVAAARSILASLRGGPDALGAFCYVVDFQLVWSGRGSGALRPKRMRVVRAAPMALRDGATGKLLATPGGERVCAGSAAPARCGLCGGLLGTGDVVDLMLGSELAVHPVFGWR